MSKFLSIFIVLLIMISCGGDPFISGIRAEHKKYKENRDKILEKLNGYLESSEKKYEPVQNSAEAWKIKGDLEIEINKDYRAAKKAYDKAISLDKENKFAPEIKSDYYRISAKNFNKSIEVYNKAITETNEEKKKDLLNSVKDDLNTAILFSDTTAVYYTILGKTLDQLKLDSKESFKKAIKYSKGEKKATALSDLGFSLFDKKMYAEAAPALEESYKLKENQDVLKFCALAYKYSENVEKSMTYLRKYLDQYQDNGTLLSLYNEALYNAGKLNELINFLESYLPTNPNVQIYNYQYLGNAYIAIHNDLKKAKKDSEANDLLKRCIKYLSLALEVEELKTNGDIWYFLAVSHQYLGNKKEYRVADKNYKKYKN